MILAKNDIYKNGPAILTRFKIIAVPHKSPGKSTYRFAKHMSIHTFIGVVKNLEMFFDFFSVLITTEHQDTDIQIWNSLDI